MNRPLGLLSRSSCGRGQTGQQTTVYDGEKWRPDYNRGWLVALIVATTQNHPRGHSPDLHSVALRSMSRTIGDLVSTELRRAESDIDRAHLANKLLNIPFGEAAWHYLALCEGRLVAPIINPDSFSMLLDEYALGALVDSIITQAKWPLVWLWKTCGDGGSIPNRYDQEMYEAALKLSELSDDYLAFEAAYTYASIGVVDLTLDGTTIIPASMLQNDARYEAYDRLVDGRGDEHLYGNEAQSELVHHVDASLRVRGERFSYRLNPHMVRLAEESMRMPLGPEPALPASWRFSRYTVGDFQRWARVMQGLCLIHILARVQASRASLREWGFADSLLIMSKRDMHRRLVRYTGLDDRTIAALLEDFTYGSRGVCLPDLALQPLVRLLPDSYAIVPNLVMSLRLERNFAVLMNRIPEERAIYSTLSAEREDLSRRRIVDALTSMRIRHWHGNVPGWDEASDIDLALMDEASKNCLILELKSFVAPAEVREICERSEEIAEGIAQVRVRRELACTRREALHKVLRVDEKWNIDWAVASESSVGGVHVQAEDVPVVRTSHLVRKIRGNSGIQGIGEWLRRRAYLPVEGRQYRVEDEHPIVAGWKIKWYNIRILIDDPYV